jgi:hypothetical protein
LTGKKISDLDHTVLVEELCLKDLFGRESSLMGSGERGGGTYVRRREVALLGGEIYGGSDREMTALVFVEDASKDGGGVEIGDAVRLDWTTSEGEIEGDLDLLGAPDPSKLTWRRRVRDQEEWRERRCCRSRVRLFSDFRCCEAVMSVGGNGGEKG